MSVDSVGHQKWLIDYFSIRTVEKCIDELILTNTADPYGKWWNKKASNELFPRSHKLVVYASTDGRKYLLER